jgi:transcription initiation factor IIE alpha subunit
MGAWAYCHKCSGGFDKPTIREAFKGFMDCWRCGTSRDLDEDDKTAAVDEVVERLERLERIVLSEKRKTRP